MNVSSPPKLSYRQKGMTLLTSLTFLLILTVVVFSASKSSIFDTYMARSNKEKNLIYQETANDLKQLATVENLYTPLINNEFDSDTGKYTFENSDPSLTQIVTDIRFDDEVKLFDCLGVSGRASSIGVSARKCSLYDFQVERKNSGGGVTDTHHVGKAKEVPSQNKYSNL